MKFIKSFYIKISLFIFVLFLSLSYNSQSISVYATTYADEETSLSGLKQGYDILKIGEDGNVSVHKSDSDKESYESENTMEKTENNLLEQYKGVIIFVSGIGLITMIIIFIVMCTKLGASGDNPSNRTKAIAGLLVDGICIALLSSLLIFYGAFYGFFHDSNDNDFLHGNQQQAPAVPAEGDFE